MILLLVLGLVTSCSTESLDNPTIAEAENNVALEQQLLTIVNEHRLSIGFSPLEFNPVAYEYANRHNDYMIAKGKISHDNFSSRASKISSEADAEYVAENVAKGFDSAKGAFAEWLSSSSLYILHTFLFLT